MIKTNKKAFTLIELLIVITIIGILGVALLPKIASGPSRARDLARKTNIASVANALELYYADNGAYLAATAATSLCTTGITDLDGYLDGGIPTDPLASSVNFTSATTCKEYLYTPTLGATSTDFTQGYTVCASVENPAKTTGYYTDDAAATPASSATAGDYYCIQKTASN